MSDVTLTMLVALIIAIVVTSGTTFLMYLYAQSLQKQINDINDMK
ncbi:MAG: hypothetical protein SXQ77_06685 [Halobacteria archaeon]|nr:hypothetical protein [Halobacteria archaeon]